MTAPHQTLTKCSKPNAIAFADVSPTIKRDYGKGYGDGELDGGGIIAHTLKGEGFDASEDGTGRGTPLVPCGIGGGETAFALRANGSHSGDKGDGGMNTTTVAVGMAVRRLTPTECERLQGFPDSWTLIPFRGKPAEQCPDGPRYKALGNSFAVPVVRWIGERLAAVDGITEGQP